VSVHKGGREKSFLNLLLSLSRHRTTSRPLSPSLPPSPYPYPFPPSPQPRPPKGALGASQCTVCARHLADVADFCSLQCKLDGASGVRSILLTAPTTPSGEPVAAGEPTDSSPALPQVDHASPASSLAAPGGGAGGATACPAAKRLRRSGSAGSGAGQQPGTPARGSEEPCGGGGGAGSESGHGGGGGGGASSPAPATAGARRKRGAPPQRAHLQ